MAFDHPANRLYVGWQGQSGRRLDAFQVADGTAVASVATPLSPLGMHPRYDEFVGFRPQSGPIGSSVLAEIGAGRILDELDRGVHVLSKRGFTGDGNMLVLSDRSEVRVLRAVSPGKAARLLDDPE